VKKYAEYPDLPKGNGYANTSGHSMKLVESHCNTDLRLYFFSLCIVSRWNNLTQIVSAPSDLQSTVFQETLGIMDSTTGENGFLYGLLVRITLLAADSGLCLEMDRSDALQLEQPHPASELYSTPNAIVICEL